MTERPHANPWPYAVSGLLAAAAGMAVGHLVAAWTDPATSPVLAVGSRVIDASPPALKDWAVSTLGTADKPVLLGSVAIVTGALAAAIGVLARRRRQLALFALTALAAVAGLAALASGGGGPLAVVPSLAAGITGLVVLPWLADRADEVTGRSPRAPAPSPAEGDGDTARSPAQTWEQASTEPHPAAARRTFVLGAGAVGLGSVVVGGAGQVLAGPVVAPRAVTLPPVPAPLPALPTGIEATVAGVSALRTPLDDFYRVDTAFTIPRVDVSTWRLFVDGMVDNELSVGFEELVGLGLVERDITLNCVSNEVGGPYIGSTRWTGVPVRLLLERAGVQSGADQVLSTSVDGMTISTPIEALLATGEREALVAIAMDGQPLPARNGYPARLITPGLYGYVGATKWVTRLTLTTFAADKAYWSTRGWAEQATVQIQTRIDTPRRGGVDAGQVAIGGVAWAQAGGGIERVEVRIDDGDWQEARLGPDVGPVYWRQWWLPWQATKGKHRLTARATDTEGTVQTSAEAPVAPSGATGWHSVDVTVA